MKKVTELEKKERCPEPRLLTAKLEGIGLVQVNVELWHEKNCPMIEAVRAGSIFTVEDRAARCTCRVKFGTATVFGEIVEQP